MSRNKPCCQHRVGADNTLPITASHTSIHAGVASSPLSSCPRRRIVVIRPRFYPHPYPHLLAAASSSSVLASILTPVSSPLSSPAAPSPPSSPHRRRRVVVAPCSPRCSAAPRAPPARPFSCAGSARDRGCHACPECQGAGGLPGIAAERAPRLDGVCGSPVARRWNRGLGRPTAPYQHLGMHGICGSPRRVVVEALSPHRRRHVASSEPSASVRAHPRRVAVVVAAVMPSRCRRSQHRRHRRRRPSAARRPAASSPHRRILAVVAVVAILILAVSCWFLTHHGLPSLVCPRPALRAPSSLSSPLLSLRPVPGLFPRRRHRRVVIVAIRDTCDLRHLGSGPVVAPAAPSLSIGIVVVATAGVANRHGACRKPLPQLLPQQRDASP